MAKCQKKKCKNNSCGPKGMAGIQKFITSPKFFVYYLLVFIIFLTMRLFKIPYGNDPLCKGYFALGTLAQFIVFYVVLLITFFVLSLVIKIIKLLIGWIKGIFKKRPNKKLGQRVGNFFIRVGLIILLIIVSYFLKFVLEIYTTIAYYTLGIVMGYTMIGGINECIKTTKK